MSSIDLFHQREPSPYRGHPAPRARYVCIPKTKRPA